MYFSCGIFSAAATMKADWRSKIWRAAQTTGSLVTTGAGAGAWAERLAADTAKRRMAKAFMVWRVYTVLLMKAVLREENIPHGLKPELLLGWPKAKALGYLGACAGRD